MWQNLNKYGSADDQGTPDAATKSCHGDKNRLTTPLTTYRNHYFIEDIYMDFDLRTTDSSYSFVLDILGMSSEQFIDEYILKKLNLQSFK